VYSFVYFLFVVVSLVVTSTALNCLERVISDMTYYVPSWTLTY